jgi:hypothetical protein
MFPGSFIWNQINDEWLTSRTASRLFAASSVIILIGTPIWFGYVEVPDTTFWENLFLGGSGVAGALSIFFLWGGCGDIGCIVTHPHERLRGFVSLFSSSAFGMEPFYIMSWSISRGKGKGQSNGMRGR